MQNISVIFSKEFKAYFLSPIAYVFVGVFVAATVTLFFMLQGWTIAYADMRGYFDLLPIIFFFFVPAISMRAWAEEKKQNTLELLLTWPISDLEVVAGKFLAGFVLLAVSVLLSLTIPITLAIMGKPDMGPIITSYLGALLLGAAYLAVGFWISSLTENQIVAFIITVIATFFLWLVGWATQFLPPALEIVASIGRAIGSGTHFDNICRGVIDSRDIVYYGVVIGFFLFLNVQVLGLRKTREQGQWYAFIGIVLGFCIAGLYLSSIFFGRLDLTDNRMYTLSKPTKKVLKNLDDIVNVKVYFSKNLPKLLPLDRRIVNVPQLKTDLKDILSGYKAYAGRNLHITWEDPNKTEEQKNKVISLGVPELQLQGAEDRNSMKVSRGFMGMVVLYEDRKEVMPVVVDLSNFEYALTDAILKVRQKETPKVGVVKTDTMPYIPPEVRMRMQMNNMQDQTEEKYKPIFENLKKRYTVETIDLSEGKAIDASYKAVIVPGGETFTDRKLFEIDQYFMNGGNLIVLADAVKVSFQYGVWGSTISPKILNLVEHYGAKVEPNMVLDVSCGAVNLPQEMDTPFGRMQAYTQVEYPYFVRVTGDGFNKTIPAVSELADAILPWASSVTLSVPSPDSIARAKKKDDKAAAPAVTGTYLLRSSAKSWQTAGSFNLNPQQDWKVDKTQFKRSTLVAYLNGKFNSYFAGKQIPPVKEPGPADTGLKAIKLSKEDSSRVIKTSNENGRLIVAGDADFLSAQNAAPGNIAFLQNVVDWFCSQEDLISIRTREMVDRSIKKDRIATKASVMRDVLVMGLNISFGIVVVIAVGLMVMYGRREENAKTAPLTAAKEQQQ